jgi:hypothetical protein
MYLARWTKHGNHVPIKVSWVSLIPRLDVNRKEKSLCTICISGGLFVNRFLLTMSTPCSSTLEWIEGAKELRCDLASQEVFSCPQSK